MHLILVHGGNVDSHYKADVERRQDWWGEDMTVVWHSGQCQCASAQGLVHRWRIRWHSSSAAVWVSDELSRWSMSYGCWTTWISACMISPVSSVLSRHGTTPVLPPMVSQCRAVGGVTFICHLNY